jgi:hypothetical protein
MDYTRASSGTPRRSEGISPLACRTLIALVGLSASSGTRRFFHTPFTHRHFSPHLGRRQWRPPISHPEADGQPLGVACVKGAMSQERDMFHKQRQTGAGRFVRFKYSL